MQINIQSLVVSRLEDMAAQVEYLVSIDDLDSAALLRDEGLALAKAYDNGYEFFFINDLKTAR